MHGVHGNPSGTVAGSEACSLHLQTDRKLHMHAAHYFVDVSLFQKFNESKLSVKGETKWSIYSKVKPGSGRLA